MYMMTTNLKPHIDSGHALFWHDIIVDVHKERTAKIQGHFRQEQEALLCPGQTALPNGSCQGDLHPVELG